MLSIRLMVLTTAIALAGHLGGEAKAGPKVVASVKPIHSLVAAVMEGVGEPSLIVDGAASPHTYSLRPSQARAIEKADVVFWVGHQLEAFLEKPLESLGAGARVVELAEAPGLTLLAPREGGAFESHDHEGEEDHEAAGTADRDGQEQHAGEHEHEHGETDMHVWLDPRNAAAMVDEIARTLETADPANADRYRANAEAEKARLDELAGRLDAALAGARGRPFIVFHDAYQYFEKRFDLAAAGSITVSPEVMPGAERIAEIRRKIGQTGAACVFAEPQFEPKLISVVIEGTDTRSAVLDPLGAELPAGADLYFELMDSMAKSFRDCLNPPS